MHTVTEALRIYFAGRENVCIARGLIVYYVEGDPNTRIVPDVFVTLGVSSEERDCYKVWAEGRPPDFVLEVTSPRKADEDRNVKPNVYASLGVQEYFQFNPQLNEQLLTPRLQGRRLRDGVYEALQARSIPGVEASIRSEVLGLEFRASGRRIQVWDEQGQRYLSALDEHRRRMVVTEDAQLLDEETRRLEVGTRVLEEKIRILEERAQANALENQRLRERIAQLEAGATGPQRGDQ